MAKRRSKPKAKGEERGYNAFQISCKAIKYCEKYRLYVVACLVGCIISVAVGIAIPIMAAQIVLRITDGVVEQVLFTALVVLGIRLLDGMTRFIRGYFLDKLCIDTIFGLQQAMVRETLRMEASEIDKNGTGKIIERLTADVDKVASVFQDYAFWTIYIVSNFGVLFAVLILSREMFFLSLIIATICFVVSHVRIKKMAVTRKKLRTSRDERTSMVSEIVRGIRDIKNLNANEAVTRSAGRKIREAVDHERKIHAIDRRYRLLEQIIYYVSEFAFLAFGCLLFSRNVLSIPAFIIVYNYLDRITDLFYGLACIVESNKEMSLSGNRIFEIVEDRTYRKEHFGPIKANRLQGDIDFRHVNFSFGKKSVINDLNMHISSNKKVAIIGKSGAGKTTIMNLLTRIYDYDSGEILIDGIPICELDRDSLRGSISVVTQQPYIFNYSVKENLRLVKPDAKMSEIREACRLACIDDYIMSLPNKYNTQLGEGGVILSGGQKQRIAIARALLMKTKIILFDEATSALDNKTQAEIQEAINNLKGDYTLIIVAHRLSTIIDSDRIFVLEDGHLVDSGTHRELLRDCVAYQSLYRKEAKE